MSGKTGTRFTYHGRLVFIYLVFLASLLFAPNSDATFSRFDPAYASLSRLREADCACNHAVAYVRRGPLDVQERHFDSQLSTLNPQHLISYTRGTDLSGSLEGAGGIGGLLGRSQGYSAGNWTAHNYYHADGNGNITALVGTNQSVSARYAYDPFGNITGSSGALAAANVYRFSSKEHHAVSGFYYYGYRWYAPGLQRWVNRDPLGEPGFEVLRQTVEEIDLPDPNLYAFVQNDPINALDYLGLCATGETRTKSYWQYCTRGWLPWCRPFGRPIPIPVPIGGWQKCTQNYSCNSKGRWEKIGDPSCGECKSVQEHIGLTL